MLGIAKKLQLIVSGWKNYGFESDAIRSMARTRAMVCADCDSAVFGMIPQFLDDEVKEIKGLKCEQCDCPLSTKLRAEGSICPMSKW